jgi:cytidine deaminase
MLRSVEGEGVVSYEALIARAMEVAVLYRASEHCDAGLVGAAVLAASGAIYTGCSVDLRCGIGFCAEHSAVAEMLKHHEARVRAIVAVNDDGIVLPPCGRCRELLYQIDPANLDSDIVIGRGEVMKLRDLLPHPWQPRHWPG